MNSPTHAPLRSVVSLILAKSFRGRLVRITDLAQLNVPHFSELKSNAFTLAFAKSDETSTLDLENMLGGDFSCLGLRRGAVLAVKLFRVNNTRVRAVGVFESALHVPDDDGIQQHLVERISERTQCEVNLPARIQADFHRYLDANKPTTRNKTKQNEKDKKRKATGEINNNNATPVKDADVDDDAIAMAAEMVAEATAIATEMGELKRKISCGLDELIANRSRLIELENKHISEDESAALALDSLLYHQDGRPGFFFLNQCHGFFTTADLKSGLVTDTEREEMKIKLQCGDTNYYVHEKYNTWTPERADVYDSRSLSHKKGG
eukprot:scaffold13339_cov32-Cyclotella_meneghiniana.AAC.2